MNVLRRKGGFTLIELLVVILILAILMAIALPLYLRAVRDSNRQTCRSNMQTIANALAAYKVRSVPHLYPGQAAAGDPIDLTKAVADAQGPAFIGADTDLLALPQCPTDDTAGDTDDYTASESATGQVTITCTSTGDAAFHNSPTGGFHPGVDAQ